MQQAEGWMTKVVEEEGAVVILRTPTSRHTIHHRMDKVIMVTC